MIPGMCTTLERRGYINPIDSQITIIPENNGIIRTYLNGAVCVESTIELIPPNLSKTDLHAVKRISCSCSSASICQVHKNVRQTKKRYKSVVELQVVEQNYSSDSSTEHDEHVTGGEEREEEEKGIVENNSEEKEKEVLLKQWISKKDHEKKMLEEKDSQRKMQVEKEKQQRLEKERECFRRWLNEKKQQELRQQREKEEELKKEKQKKEEKDKRQLQCELTYQLWLKEKEVERLKQRVIKKRIKQRIDEERARRLEENRRAYQEWLRNSSNKPKPVPAGKGLDSLRSCASVMYVNPIPWHPNVETRIKPSSM